MPEKVEVFVDDQKILVDPGTTVLQVGAMQYPKDVNLPLL